MDNQTPKPGTAQAAPYIPESLSGYLSHNMTWDDVRNHLHRIAKNYSVMALLITHHHSISDDPDEADISPIVTDYIADIEWLHEFGELA